MDSRIKPDGSGARQQNRISPEEWELVDQYRAALEQERAEQEAPKPEPPRSPILCGYCRCSHRDSKETGLGLDAQHNMIGRWADFIRSDYPELGEPVWFEDKAVSAFSIPLTQRPGGGAMNRALRRGDHVVFAYLDRAFRNTEDCLQTLRHWKARGIIVHFADLRIDSNTVMGELLVTILAAVARMESAMKSERIKEVFAALKAEGRLGNGKAPLGFKLAGRRGRNGKWIKATVIPDVEVKRIIGEIIRVRDKYGWPWERISDHVEAWLAEREKRPQADGIFKKRVWSWHRCRWAYLQMTANGEPDHGAST